MLAFLFLISVIYLFFLSSSLACWKIINFTNLVKEPSLGFTDFLIYCFTVFYFIDFWSDLYQLFPSTYFGFHLFILFQFVTVETGFETFFFLPKLCLVLHISLQYCFNSILQILLCCVFIFIQFKMLSVFHFDLFLGV